jgi:hypothetical protein
MTYAFIILDTGCIIVNVESVWYPGQSLLTPVPGRNIKVENGLGTARLHRKLRDTIIKEVQSDGFGRKNPALSRLRTRIRVYRW